MSDDRSEPHESLPADLKSFEAMLGSLRPVASRIDRDRLMYEAGGSATLIPTTAQSHRLKLWLWPCASASAALLVIAATLGAALALRGPSAERIVYVSRPADARVMSPTLATPMPNDAAIDDNAVARLSEQSNFVLRERAVRLGVDAIGFPHNSAAGPTTPETGNRSLLQQMLGT